MHSMIPKLVEMEKEKILSPTSRRKIILSRLQDHGIISTQEIANELNTSQITIRRDLSKLEEKGLIIRTHRGVVRNAATMSDLFAFDDKINLYKKEKREICQLAAGHIVPGDVIFIDCGSTPSILTSYIRDIDQLTVITNSLPIASELINFTNIKLILIGGEVNYKRKAIYGYSAINNISQYHANKAFIGADGVSLSYGITSHSEQSATITLKMAENSDTVFLLCDHSKIEKKSLVKFASLSMIDYLLTDQNIDRGLIGKYAEMGVSLVCEEK